MEGFRSPNASHQNSETLIPASCYSRSCEEEASPDSILCIPGSRLVPCGFSQMNCADDILMFINSGGGDITDLVKEDCSFQGGDVIRTDESISNGGEHPSLYQSARYGNFCYCFNSLVPGDYFVDLHFAEIVNINGPKGMRVFNVFVQEDKVLSEMDIFSIVGANKPLQLVDARVSVKENGKIIVRFEGVRGSPIICGICVRKAPRSPASSVNSEYLVCNNCSSRVEVSYAQNRSQTVKDIAKYEKKIQELSSQCQLKTDECYEAWMSLTAANGQLEQLRMELDNKFFQVESLDQAMQKQAVHLKEVSERYERDKNYWIAAVNDLEGKIMAMKSEHDQLSKEAHDCADSIPELNNMIVAVQSLVVQCEDLKLKYSEEITKRKKLYNQFLETKGNIRVFCRCRPLNKEEISSGFATVVDFDGAKEGELSLQAGNSKKNFKFDRVFTPKDDQVDVFSDASPLVISVLDGYNVCIFAYGQTGTGKTFTMEGTQKNRGVNYRTLEELFRIAKEREDTFAYNISVSVLEVYNEQIRDLLATSPASKKLEIRLAGEGSHHVPGIVEAKVENIKEVWDVLQTGSNARATGSNNVNEHSSRSHCMLCIMVKAKNLMNGECTKSKLWLVDLAGSERLAKTEAQGDRLKEAQNINRSLSALGDVISALATKSCHIPYRNSKLTHLLQDSLGGDSKTLMFVQISPSENDMGETLSSLNFATRVRGVELGPAKKQIDTSELQRTKQMLDKVRQDLRQKDETIRKLEENSQNWEAKLRSKDQTTRNQQEKLKDLEGQLELKMQSQSQSEKHLCQLSEKLKGKEEMCMQFQQKVRELEYKVKEQQSQSSMMELKVKELESKLQEHQNSEVMTLTLQQKVKELESKLHEHQNSEVVTLRQKVKELENKLHEKSVQTNTILLDSADKLKCSPKCSNRKHSFDECLSDPTVLRSSNSVNRLANHLLPRTTDSLHETRRKREKRSGSFGESENYSMVGISSSLLEKKAVEVTRPRQLDQTRARTLGRPTRPSKSVGAAQKNNPRLNKANIGREQQATGKERDKARVWSR